MNAQVQKIYDWLIEAKEQATIAKRPFEADSPNRIPYYNGKNDLCVNLIAFIKNELNEEEHDECSGCTNVKGCVTCVDGNMKEFAEDKDLEKAAEEYAYTNWESEDYHEGASEGLPFDPIGHTEKSFKAGAEWQREQMEDGHGKELLYVCQKTAEREHRSGVREGKAQAEKELIPLINRLCEAILFEWKDAADLARKTLTQIKTREEE